MQAEEYRYTLKVAGRPVGEQVWSVSPDRHHWVLRVQTDFSGGFLGGGRRVQLSRMHPVSRVSASYLETGEGGGRAKAQFETVFDRKTGLVTLRQGRDEAEIPLVQDYQDPLSLLHFLRELPEDLKHLEVPMVGVSAHVQRLPDSALEFAGEEVPVKVYYLRPGRAAVYIEQEEPHRILRLIQPLEAGVTLESAMQELRPSGRERRVGGPEPKVRLEREGKKRRRR